MGMTMKAVENQRSRNHEDKMNGAGSIFKYLEVRKNIQRSGDRTVATSLHDKQGPYLYVPQE